MEACTASLPPEAAEPDAQQEAAVAAAEPVAQQVAVVAEAAVAEPDAQQAAVVAEAAVQLEARPLVPLAEFAETAIVRSWIQATWFLVRALE